MIIALLLFSKKDIDSLMNNAVKNAKANVKMAGSVPALMPGQYNLPGLSFNLLKSIFNQKTNDCKGYALDQQNGLIAILQNDQNQKTNFTFADIETKQFYEIKHFVTNKNNAFVYSVQKADIFTIISDIKVRTVPSKGYNCSFDNTTLTSVCQAWFGYNWQKPKQDEDPFDLNPITTPIFGGLVKAQIGAYAHAYGSLGIDFKGFNDMAINYDLEFEAVGGIGFTVDQNISDKSAKLGEKCFPIFGFDYEILGVPIVLKFDACADFGLDNFTLAVPHRINYYRRASYSLKKSGRISPKGNEGVPFNYMLQPSSTSEFENYENFDFSNDVALNVTPIFDIFARVKFQVGSEIKCSVKIGTELDLDFHFGASNEKCLCPYLYGNIGASLNGYLRSKELRINGWEILPKFDFTYKLFKVHPQSSICLFSAQNTMEGFSSLVSNATAPSVILWPHNALSNSSGLYSIRMDAFDSKYAQSLPLESMQFSKKDTNLNLSRMLVLNGFAENTNIKFEATKYNLIFDDYFTFNSDISIIEDDDYVTCGSAGGDDSRICIETEVSRASEVELFKEFSGQNLRYVSFHPITSTKSDDYTLIIHGTDESYSVGGVDVMDDTATESKDGKYTTGNTMRIFFENVYFEAGVSSKPFKANLWFYRCTDGDNCVPAGHLYLNETYRKHNNTAEELGVNNWSIPINAEDSFLKVTLSLDTMFWETRKEWILYFNESNASASIEDGAYKIDLRFEKYSPNVLFRVKELPSGFRGIVTRMYETDTDNLMIGLEKGEQYFVSSFNRPVYNGTFAIVEIPPSISPLYEHQQLDNTHVYIPLRNSRKLKIPMRRSKDEKERVNISIKIIFNGGQNSEPFCATSDVILNGDNDLPIGCLETKQTSEKFETKWVPTIDLPYLYNAKECDKWKLNIYNFDLQTKASHRFNFVVSEFKIPENSTNYFISKETISRIRKSSSGLGISCERCKSVIALTESGKENKLEFLGSSILNYRPESDESIILRAVCKSEEESYCEFEKALNMSVLRFKTDDGVIDLYGNDFIRGVSRQILLKNGTFRIAKTWTGRIEIESSLVRSHMEVTYHQSGYYSIVSAKLGDNSIPLSAAFYQKDPIGFFKSLGATTDSFKEGDVEFLSDGRAKIKTSIIDPSLANYTAASGLPSWLILSTNYKREGISPLAIGLIAVGIIVFVGLVVGTTVFIICRRKTAEKDEIISTQLLL